MNSTSEKIFENALRDALTEATPPAADAAIREAIRSAVHAPQAQPSNPFRNVVRWFAAAACIAIALGVGTWIYGREHATQTAALREEGDIMLEIIGLASVDDVYSIDGMDIAQL